MDSRKPPANSPAKDDIHLSQFWRLRSIYCANIAMHFGDLHDLMWLQWLLKYWITFDKEPLSQVSWIPCYHLGSFMLSSGRLFSPGSNNQMDSNWHSREQTGLGPSAMMWLAIAQVAVVIDTVNTVHLQMHNGHECGHGCIRRWGWGRGQLDLNPILLLLYLYGLLRDITLSKNMDKGGSSHLSSNPMVGAALNGLS
jgi:hypothetical protein